MEQKNLIDRVPPTIKELWRMYSGNNLNNVPKIARATLTRLGEVGFTKLVLDLKKVNGFDCSNGNIVWNSQMPSSVIYIIETFAEENKLNLTEVLAETEA